MSRVCALLAALLAVILPHSTAAGTAPRIAIIIDDLGYQLAAGRRVVALPGPVACAILPGTPRARLLAAAAHESGKEVLLHLPMQAAERDGGNGAAEPASITMETTRESFSATFKSAFKSVPYVVGVNNHRGSLLTRQRGHMQWLMDEISEHETIFFVDSYTTAGSVALQVATETGVQAVRRDVFLDPDRDPETVAREFARLKSVAERQGFAVAIGHPYAATLELLERELPQLAAEGFELVPVSAIPANL